VTLSCRGFALVLAFAEASGIDADDAQRLELRRRVLEDKARVSG